MLTSVRLLLAAALLLSLPTVQAAQLEVDTGTVAEAGAGTGAQLWRAGDHGGAARHWRERLEAEGASPAERARLTYNLGVAAHGADDPLLASAWFEASLRIAPRGEDASVNRDIARAEAGLSPAGSGDLSETLVHGLRLLTRSEAEWLALGGALFFAVFGLLDALRGGRFRGLAWLALLLQPVFWAPLLTDLLTSRAGEVMVIAQQGTTVYAGPERSSKEGGGKVGTLAAGAIATRVDALPGWTKVVFAGEERWVASDSVMALDW